MIVRNVCDAVEPPRLEFREVEPLCEDDLAKLLEAVRGNNLEGPVWLAALTGLRRGEILGLGWNDVDLEAGSLTVRRTLQQGSKGETYFKEPKSAASRRQMALPPMAIELLRGQSAKQAAKKLSARKIYREDLNLFSLNPTDRRGSLTPSAAPSLCSSSDTRCGRSTSTL
jgi:integrase